jgi:hypothetical protein
VAIDLVSTTTTCPPAVVGRDHSKEPLPRGHGLDSRNFDGRLLEPKGPLLGSTATDFRLELDDSRSARLRRRRGTGPSGSAINMTKGLAFTNVAMACIRLPIRDPSQWPGTARSSASAGCCRMLNVPQRLDRFITVWPRTTGGVSRSQII